MKRNCDNHSDIISQFNIPSKKFYNNSIEDLHEIISLRLLYDDELKEKFTYKKFHKQKDAFIYADMLNDDVKVFSKEITKKNEDKVDGKRTFIVADYESFWDVYKKHTHKHFYEVIRENTPCKLYFDIDSPNIDKKEGEGLILSLIDLIVERMKFDFNKNVSYDSFIDLDSTSNEKFSHHLIVNDCVFINNEVMGYYVNYLVNEFISVNEKYEKLKDMIDISVYSRNRNFRLYLSSKSGKNNILNVSNINKYPFYSQKQFFLSSLVCNIPDVKKDEYLSFSKPENNNICLNYKRQSSRLSDKYEELTIENSKYPLLDQFILNQLKNRPGSSRPTIRSIMNIKNLIIYNIGENRWCENIGREHKSNHIMIIVNLDKSVYYQKWYVIEYHLYNLLILIIIFLCSQDCRSFKGNEYPIPPGLYTWKTVFDEIDDNVLIESVEKLNNC